MGPMLSAGCLHALLDFRTHRAGMKNQPVAGINTVKRSHCSLRRRIRGRHEPCHGAQKAARFPTFPLTPSPLSLLPPFVFEKLESIKKKENGDEANEVQVKIDL